MKNQVIVKLGLALILLSFGGNRASGTELVYSNFNDTTFQGWVASTTAGSPPALLSNVAGNFETTGTSGRYVLQMDDSSASGGSTYATLSKAFTPQTGGSLDISFKIRFVGSGTNSPTGDWRLALVGNTGSIYLRMKVSGSGSGFSYYNGSTNQYVPSSITDIAAGQWYDVRIAANLEEKTYGWTAKSIGSGTANQIAVTGSATENSPFYQSGTAACTASAFAIVSRQRGGTFQIDDVRVAGFRNNLVRSGSASVSYQYMSVVPSYPGCTDSGTTRLLTDGIKHAPGYISPSLWSGTTPACVGWVNASEPIIVQVNLGTNQAISGVAMNMCAATSAGASWPAHILAFTGTGGTGGTGGIDWHYLSDLVYTGESANNILSDGGWRELGTRVYKFSSDVQTHGQYICFAVIPSSGYVFTDEVEVYEGDHSWLNLPYSGTTITGTAGIKNYSLDYRIAGGVLKRIKLDENELTKRIETASILDAQKADLKARLLTAANAARAASLPPANSFEARIPFPSNDWHAAMYGVQGQLWADQQILQPVVWKMHRFQWLDAFKTPPCFSDTNPLSTSVLKDEVRGETLLISNPTNAPIKIDMSMESQNFPDSGWLRVFKGAWTDTFERVVLSSALEEVDFKENKYTFCVPAGTTTRLWLQVDAHELVDHCYRGDIHFDIKDPNGNDQPVAVVPWKVRVSCVALNPARLTTFMWDYMNGSGHSGLVPGNRSQAYALMQSHLVNSVWGLSGVLPYPTADCFDASNKLVKPLDFTALNSWLGSECPGASRYFIYLGPGTTKIDPFAGAAAGTPEFTAKAEAWAAAIANDVASQGINPSKLAMLVYDEPSNDSQFELTRQWFSAITTSGSGIQCFINPKITGTTSLSTYSGAIAAADIVCPYTYTYAATGSTSALRNYYRQQETPPKSLYFYLSAAPAKLLDPSYYYRLHPWYVFGEGGRGMGFWSIGDVGGATSTWNEYVAVRDNYSPVYLTGTRATTSVHFEALREGIEDNELFSEIAELSGTNAPSSIQDRWSSLKARISKQAGTFTITPRWPEEVDPDTLNAADSPDEIRRDAIQLLENAHGLTAP